MLNSAARLKQIPGAATFSRLFGRPSLAAAFFPLVKRELSTPRQETLEFRTGGRMFELEDDRFCKLGQRDCRLTTARGRSCSECWLCLCPW